LDEQRGAILVDLGSTSGTSVNGKVVHDNTGVALKDGDEVLFGASTRHYKVTVDYSKFKKALEEKQKALQNEIEAIDTLSDTKIEDLRKKLGSSVVDTLYVGNLPYHYEESDIRTLFKGCG
jgi:pSer/pThr/pTyr-binding forkhead associated (FHA) protein